MAPGTPTKIRSVCSYCGVGCGVVLEVGRGDDGRRRVLGVTGDTEHPANRGRLCTKGATVAEAISAPGRLERALVRSERGADPTEVPIDDALADVAGRLRSIVDEHGPDAVALYVSGQMTIEAQYLANKLAKGFIGTNQIESNSRLCMASAGAGYKLSLGADGPPGSYDDLDQADLFLVIGSNMADCHPVLFLRMMDRVREGAKLVVVDPRRTATAEKADLHLPIAPGTDLALLNGLLHLLVEDGRIDTEFIDAHTEGWEAMPGLLADYPPDVVAEITGLDVDDLRTAARWIGEAGAWTSCWTMGLNQSTHGTWSTNALCNLHLATGSICRPGAGPFSLTGQPNAMGGREMGYMGPGLPGQRSALDPADRAAVEQLWSIPPGTIRADPGAGTIDLFQRMADGEIKACWIICTNPIATVPNRSTVVAGLTAAELVVVQDVVVDTETNAYADVLLPAAMWSEADGVMVNSERTMTLAPRAADPPGDAMADWEIIARVASLMGYADDFAYPDAAAVFDELRGAANPATGYDVRGVSHERLRTTPVQWPAPDPDGDPRHPIRYLDDAGLRFPTPSGRARFHARPHVPPAEAPDDDHPFLLDTGRVQHQWHTRTKTGRVAALNRLDPGPFLEIHPDDAAGLDVADGDQVEVRSRRGRAVLPAVVTDRVLPGCCFAPFHWNEGEDLSVNAVTNDAVDPISLQPEIKLCAVALTKVAAAAPAESSDDDRAPGLVAELALAGARPKLDPTERTYLDGFLTGLRAAPPTDHVPVLPPTAPLAPATATWVDGLLAGMFSRRPAPADLTTGSHATGSHATPGRPIVVLWASQTGTAEALAGRVADRLRAVGAVTAAPMDATGPADLPAACDLVVVTSTFGDGDPPDNGRRWWDDLAAEDAALPADVRFAVLALGSSAYRDFCGHGRRIDERLAALGAFRLLPRVDCEAHDEVPAQAWLDALAELLADRDDHPRTEREAGGPPISGAAPLPTGAGGGAATAVAAARRVLGTSKDTALPARLVANRLLSGSGSAKEVRELVIDTSEHGLTYEPGDALGVLPTNHPWLVDEWIAATGIDRTEVVDVADHGLATFGEALTRHLEIAEIGAELLRFVADRTGDRRLATLLRPDNHNERDRWRWGRQAIDLLHEHPVRAPAEEWVAVLPRLRPRLYSIASSPLHDPTAMRLTVSVVRYENPVGARRHGVCSSFLADTPRGTTVPVFVQRSPHFRPPTDPDAPTIMIGPGTGVSPFVGFLEHRRARGDAGDNWLFFGDQHRATDFLYEEELGGLSGDGTLTRLDLAFSRDQRRRTYVQDRMREHGAAIWSWLDRGAHVYVCGDAHPMARDVDATLREIVARHGRLDDEDVEAYLSQLTATGRYARDVY